MIGGGHSAANVLLDLAQLAEHDLRTSIIWAVRAADLSRVFGGGIADKLPARGKLGDDLRHLVDHGRLALALGFSVERIDRQGDGLLVFERAAQNPRVLGPVDRIIVCTGQRPDLSMTRELRLDLDPWLESARTLGPLIDPNLHSCGTVPPHGYKAACSSRARLLRGRRQELWSRADLPDGDRLRAGPLLAAHSRATRPPRRRSPRAAGNRGVLGQHTGRQTTRVPAAAADQRRSVSMRAASRMPRRSRLERRDVDADQNRQQRSKHP